MTKRLGRYDTSHLLEDQTEPGSHGRVLKNSLGIKSKREMDRTEATEYVRALSKLVKTYDQNHRFTAVDICKIHQVWLGAVYLWAGKYRQVNLAKGQFPFAPAREIPRLMLEFERGPLRQFTPCCFKSDQEIAKALAITHAELVLIHPFREGNGRTARLLTLLMALQAGLPALDFGGVTGRKRKEYFSAVQVALSGDYEPMSKIFRDVLSRTHRVVGGR